jgi:hypothetical protein
VPCHIWFCLVSSFYCPESGLGSGPGLGNLCHFVTLGAGVAFKFYACLFCFVLSGVPQVTPEPTRGEETPEMHEINDQSRKRRHRSGRQAARVSASAVVYRGRSLNDVVSQLFWGARLRCKVY